MVFPGVEHYAENHTLVIIPIIYAEISVSFERIEDLEEVLSPACFRRDQLPWEAGFLAGKCSGITVAKVGTNVPPCPISLLELTPLLPNSHF